MHRLLVRAIVTGFGLRIGSELGKLVAGRMFPKDEDDKKDEEEDEDDGLGSISADPPDVNRSSPPAEG